MARPGEEDEARRAISGAAAASSGGTVATTNVLACEPGPTEEEPGRLSPAECTAPSLEIWVHRVVLTREKRISQVWGRPSGHADSVEML